MDKEISDRLDKLQFLLSELTKRVNALSAPIILPDWGQPIRALEQRVEALEKKMK